MFLQFPFFMHFFKINMHNFDFCIKYVVNIDMTNVFKHLKLIKMKKTTFQIIAFVLLCIIACFADSNCNF